MRNPFILLARVFIVVSMSIYNSGIFYRFSGEYSNIVNWTSLTGFHFFMTVATLMGGLTPVAMTFPMERQVFLKEEGSKLYSLSAYFLSKNIIQIPISIIISLIQVLIMYWFVGLTSTVEQFFIYYLITLILTIGGVSIGLLIGSLVMDIVAVSTTITVVIMPFFIFAGFLKNPANMPIWYGWIQYISPCKYGFAAWILNEVNGTVPSNIDFLNLDTGLWFSVIMLLVLAAVFNLLSFILLWATRTRV